MVIQKVGAFVLATATDIGALTALTAKTIGRTFRRPFEWKELLKQLEAVGVNSLPVIMLTGTFIGMVLALQTYDSLARFQAEAYVPGLLGIALSRELVPVIGGLMVAGRVGSAMAAEVGTMTVTNQIDALEVMATDPIQYLVVPRVLATTIMLPLLIAIGDLIGILGGWYLVTVVLEAPFSGFMDRVFQSMDPGDFWSGILKAAFFGAIIAAVGCYQGLSTRGGAEGVGRSTTTAVVKASLAILIADFFLTKVLY